VAELKFSELPGGSRFTGILFWGFETELSKDIIKAKIRALGDETAL
jgi:hypothetical protein